MIHDRIHRKSVYVTSIYWDSKAEGYDASAVSMWPNTILNEYYNNELMNIIDLLKLDYNISNVLDLGCGTGIFSRWFAAQGAQVKGIDFSEKAIQIAISKSNSENITYHVSSIFDINEQIKYNLIFIKSVLSVACSSNDQLISVFNILKPLIADNGSLFICEPIHKGFLSRVLNINITEFTNILSAQGFKISFVKPICFWPVRLLLCYVPWPKFITSPIYYLGVFLQKLPLLSRLGDYWCISATLKK